MCKRAIKYAQVGLHKGNTNFFLFKLIILNYIKVYILLAILNINKLSLY